MTLTASWADEHDTLTASEPDMLEDPRGAWVARVTNVFEDWPGDEPSQVPGYPPIPEDDCLACHGTRIYWGEVCPACSILPMVLPGAITPGWLL